MRGRGLGDGVTKQGEGGRGSSSGSTALPQHAPAVSFLADTRGAQTTQTRHRATAHLSAATFDTYRRTHTAPHAPLGGVGARSRPRPGPPRQAHQQSGGRGWRRWPQAAGSWQAARRRSSSWKRFFAHFGHAGGSSKIASRRRNGFFRHFPRMAATMA